MSTTMTAGPNGRPSDDLVVGHEDLEKRRRKIDRRTYWGLLIPGALGLVVSYVLPLLWILRMSFNEGGPNGLVISAFSLDSFLEPLTDPYYLEVTYNTFKMGLIVAVLCVIVSYPIGLFLARMTSRWKGMLTALAIAPLLTSSVVRSYGWIVILGSDGLVNSSLTGLGVISTPLKLTNNMTGVEIGLVEIFMPYAILVMISGFGQLNTQLEQAAASLGASRLKVFTRITLRLSLPGLLTAFLLVFVLAISTFVTPRLLGGGSVRVLATEIYDQANVLINWPLAAALSVIVFALFGIVISIYQRLIRKVEGIDE
jgi:putative spermidine/putrescine transport system permease protein